MSEEGKKTCEFRAEVRKVLQILTNSLYTNKEIFLRELISNASDALDKLRFRQNSGETPIESDLPLEIRITLDKDARQLTISDTGIGMTEQELGDNLGIIARSGSEQFLAQLAEQSAGSEGEDGGKKAADASQIIGHFGVGFYSVFMIASRVEVYSRPAFGDGGVFVWESDGLGTYTVSSTAESEPVRGTKIVIHLKDDAEEYAEKYRIEGVIRKHSGFVPFPVYVDGEKVNTQPALWREPKSQVTPEQYKEFYKSFTYDQKEPMDWLHINVDLPVQFQALLFIPDEKQDLRLREEEYWGLDLYSNRVLIQHKNKDLIPVHLGFLKGIVDTDDLPLNISRETLQENRVLRKISQTIVKQTLSHLEKMAADDPEKYTRFWDNHGTFIKFGLQQDYLNRERLISLLRFNSSAMEDEKAVTSLEDYMKRGLEGQKTIWFVTAPNREAAKVNPYMDRFRRKGIEVLFFYEALDEFMLGEQGPYKEWTFKSIEKAEDKDLEAFADKEDSTPKAAPLSEEDEKTFDGLVARMKEVLGGKVKDVVVSSRLADSAAVLSMDDGITSAMDKFMRSMGKDDTIPVKTLEVNREHPLLRALLRIYKADGSDAILTGMIEGLFDSAQLMDGFVRDPQELAARNARLLEQSAAWYAEVRKL
ncbi:MAG: molecular chaperone HtpG [Desulfovibrionaceae bacterium]|nr:molecular chaperone HtpG [Desulfovibrionaceae bacterium]